MCGTSWRISFKLNVSAARTFHFSFVFSLVSYGVAAWGGVLLTHECTRLKSLFRRIVLNLFAWHFPGKSYDEICSLMGILRPIAIYKLFLMTLYFNIVNSDYLPALKFERKKYTHSHRTESQLVVPFPRTNVVKSNYYYQMPHIWNSLSNYLQSQKSVHKFKVAYKQQLLTEQTGDN